MLLAVPSAPRAEGVRVATWDPGLTRRGPGLLARDLVRGEEAQIAAVLAVLGAARADIVLLTGVDWDAGGVAARLLADRLAGAGLSYPYHHAPRPNTGVPTGHDADRDGRRGGPRDAQGYGRFPGEGGLLILSRWPIEPGRDFTGLLWRDLPGALVPAEEAAGLAVVQRLSSTAQVELGVRLPGGTRLGLLAYAATPPVFDGAEDRNGRRNHDETALWLRWLDGALGPPPAAPFVLLGQPMLDPADGEGRRAALQALLAHPALQDPAPRGQGAPADASHRGDPAQDTALFRPPVGALRVDVVLPSADLQVRGAGVLWPGPDDPFAATVAAASRHRLVWVDLAVPDAGATGRRPGIDGGGENPPLPSPDPSD